MQEPFFAVTDGGLVPQPHARSPWSPDMLHGRLLAGLAAWAIERDHGDPEMQPVRLTVDLYRSPAMAPTSVATTLVRRGRRVRAVDAVIHVGGEGVARASSLFLRRDESPEAATEGGSDDAPRTPRWDAPPPEALPLLVMPSGDVPFDIRAKADSGFAATGGATRQVWLREHRELVAGAELTPFVRAALVSDFASPLANMGADGLAYINADASLHLGRLPVGEWIGVSTGDRVVGAGVSVAECPLHDVDGPIGWASVCAVLNPRMPRSGS